MSSYPADDEDDAVLPHGLVGLWGVVMHGDRVKERFVVRARVHSTCYLVQHVAPGSGYPLEMRLKLVKDMEAATFHESRGGAVAAGNAAVSRVMERRRQAVVITASKGRTAKEAAKEEALRNAFR